MASLAPFPHIVISHLEGRAKAIHYRQTQLYRLQAELIKSRNEIKAAIMSDEGHTSPEADFEYTLVLSELRQHYELLDRKHENDATRQIELGNDNAGRNRNTSIVYIVPTTHTLLYSVLSPVCGVISAWSCAIVELPQNLRSLTSTLRRVLTSSLDGDTFAISDSRPTDADFMHHCTLVLQSQPEGSVGARRTCVSPSSLGVLAVVDRTAMIDEAAQSIVQARFSRLGSSPYAPDLVLVNEFVIQEFITRLLRHVTSRMAHENVSLGGASSIQKSDAALLRQKINGSILVVHAISSLEDGIALATHCVNSSTLAASFIFAALPEANYLANFIDAHVACVNHIPAELLVGPIAPVQHTPSLSPRYTRAMFEDPRPQLLHKTTLTKLVQMTDGNPSDIRLRDWKKSVMGPLPPVDRKRGKDVDFFLQALMTGVTVVVLPILVGVAVALKHGLPCIGRRV
ncbi:hypothetical protein MMC13_000204 [Lambiella insularis]|nr:hypothetical protein [Lambiella insularis]